MNMNLIRHLIISCTTMFLITSAVSAQNKDYDPLAVSFKNVETIDMTVHDKTRKRDIPIRIYLSQRETPAAVVLFSHGLGGSREGSAYLGKHWALRGYIAVFLQHPGSDASVWKNIPASRRMEAMKKAANLKNFLLRFKDIPAVLDQLAEWNKNEGHTLAGKMDLTRIGMSGHSFGAVTTQGVSGQTFGILGKKFTDQRIKAAVIFSPSNPRGINASAAKAFGNVNIPWMLMTGTKDISVISDTDMQSRLAVFPALPPGGKYELVLYGAEHSAFTERALPSDTEPKNPNHHRSIMALSTAFWDAWLSGNDEAKEWLDGEGPSSVLEKKDRWQKK